HPVRVVEETCVDEQGGFGGGAGFVGEREGCDQRPLAAPQVMGQLAALPRLDAVVRTLVSASRVPVVLPVVDEHVLDALAVSLVQELRRIAADTEDEVAVLEVEAHDAAEARGPESAHRLLHGLRPPRADDDKSHGESVSFSRTASRSGMPSFTISSTGASRIACTEPKCRRRARLRAGPIPSTESSGDVSALRARTLRWWVIAKRCASSRIRWTRNMPG